MKFAEEAVEPGYAARGPGERPVGVEALAGPAGFARNACVPMGNWLAEEDEPPSKAVTVLLEALSDPAPLVRGHAVWALDRISSVAARSELKRRASVEEDPWVRLEIISALERSRPTRK